MKITTKFLTPLFLAGSIALLGQANRTDNMLTIFQHFPIRAPKSEFETDAQYAARTTSGYSSKEYVFTYHDNWFQNPNGEHVGPGDRSQYNAEKSVLIFSDKTQEMEKNVLKLDDPAIHFLRLSYTAHEEGNYLGQNSFGAKTQVTRKVAYNLGLILSLEDREWLCSSYDEDGDCSSHFELGMPAAQAKLLKPFLQLAYVGEITDNLIQKADKFYDATFHDPIEFVEHQQAVLFHIVEVRVIDIRNGKVYATFNNSGPGAPAQSVP